MWRMAVISICAVLLVILGAEKRTSGGGESSAGTVTPEYIKVEAIEVQQYPEKFVRFFLRIKDRYDEMLPGIPRELRAQGFTAQKYLAFTTGSGYGSDMVCLVARKDIEAIAVLQTAVRDTKLILYGQLRDIVDVQPVFIVHRVIRGWDEPTLPENLRMTLEWEGGKTREYRIPKIGKEYRYEVKSPYTGKPLYLTFYY